MFSWVGLINPLLARMIVHTAFRVSNEIGFLGSFFGSIPTRLEESAIVDGCTKLGALRRILMPLILPGIVATACWSYIVACSEYWFAYTLIERGRLGVVSVGLASYIGEYATPWDQIMAGAVIATIPGVGLFKFLQPYIRGGLTAGAVEG